MWELGNRIVIKISRTLRFAQGQLHRTLEWTRQSWRRLPFAEKMTVLLLLIGLPSFIIGTSEIWKRVLAPDSTQVPVLIEQKDMPAETLESPITPHAHKDTKYVSFIAANPKGGQAILRRMWLQVTDYQPFELYRVPFIEFETCKATLRSTDFSVSLKQHVESYDLLGAKRLFREGEAEEFNVHVTCADPGKYTYDINLEWVDPSTKETHVTKTSEYYRERAAIHDWEPLVERLQTELEVYCSHLLVDLVRIAQHKPRAVGLKILLPTGNSWAAAALAFNKDRLVELESDIYVGTCGDLGLNTFFIFDDQSFLAHAGYYGDIPVGELTTDKQQVRLLKDLFASAVGGSLVKLRDIGTATK